MERNISLVLLFTISHESMFCATENMKNLLKGKPSHTIQDQPRNPVVSGFPSLSSHLYDLRTGITLFMLRQYKVTIICATAPNN